jgi:nucleoside transporter
MSVAGRLSVMMFLEYVIWGSWLPMLSRYLSDFLGFSGTQIAWVFGTLAIASIALLLTGQIADRYLPPERLLAVSHLIGGAAMLSLPFQKSFGPFFIAMLVHNLAYVPTLSLTNAICFHHLHDSQRQFGIVRLWGTIGWIAASWPFILLLRGKTGAELGSALTWIFWVAGGASIALGLYSLTLPHTPPARTGEKNAPLEAIKFLAVPAFLVLFVVTFMDSMVHACYFFWTGPFLAHIGIPDNWIPAAMSIGQIAEIATMASLGFFIKRLGWRRIMIFGILGHAFRFGVYAMGVPSLVVASNVVHGFCYAFFFASVYIFVDQYFPKDARASAQGLFNLLILGLGPFLGNLLWGKLGDVLRTAAGVDYRTLFLAPTGLALLAAITLAIGFHPPSRPVEEQNIATP